MARLSYHAGGCERTFPVGDSFTVGRDESNDLALADDGAVSRQHARIRRIGDSVVVEDLESRNGTFVDRDGEVIRVALPTELRQGDVICVGAARLSVDLSEAPEPSSDTEIIDSQLTNVPGATAVGRGVPIPADPTPQTPQSSDPASRIRLLILIGAAVLAAVAVAALALLLSLI